jgi:hypothetical protein
VDTPNAQSPRNPTGLPSSWRFSRHMPRSKVDPGRPSSTHPIALSVWASGPLKPSPSTLQCQALLRLFRGCIKLQEVRSSLWPVSFPVYASIVSFGLRLLYNCNTRYEWLVRPYSPGTFTLEETPSFPWRTNGRHQARGGYYPNLRGQDSPE